MKTDPSGRWGSSARTMGSAGYGGRVGPQRTSFARLPSTARVMTAPAGHRPPRHPSRRGRGGAVAMAAAAAAGFSCGRGRSAPRHPGPQQPRPPAYPLRHVYRRGRRWKHPRRVIPFPCGLLRTSSWAAEPAASAPGEMEAKKGPLGVPGTPRFQADPRVPRAQQLQFCWNAPASSGGGPDRYTSPRPIVIEKLKPPEDRRSSQDPSAGNGLDHRSSMEFSVVSQEKLHWAVQLAKRDIKRRRLEEQAQKLLSGSGEGPTPSSPRGKESGHVPVARAAKPLPRHRGPLAHPSKMEATGPQAKVYLYNPTQGKSQLPLPDSPPTHDPGPGPVLRKEEDRSTLEVRQLQKELQGYIQKVEELARKERGERTLDPDEERRVRIRRQEQVVRSNRMLYVLQQQVKEIQEDLDQLSPHKIKHTKKSRAMARLAAAHRRAIRALQTLVAHFARDQPQLPSSSTLHVRQMGHLLRQLSLCSARLEMDSSVVPEVIMDLLLQIEDLDTLLAQQASPKPRPCSLLPPKGEALRGAEPKKSTAARKLLPDALPESAEIFPQQEAIGDRRLSCGARRILPPSQAEAVMWQDGREASGLGKTAIRPGLDCGPSRRRGGMSSFSSRPQGSGRMLRAKGPQPLAKQARFKEPTVSFRLKETKPPLQESQTPWGPTSLSSPLSSPQRRSERGPKGKEPALEKEVAGGGRHRALKKEVPRADSGSPAQIADKIEQAVRERLEPLLAKVQKVNLSLERDVSPKESLGDNQPPAQETEKAMAVAAAPTGIPEGDLEALAVGQQGVGLDLEVLLPLRRPLDLEAMLQRMEEMERFQQDVRRRYHRVIYSDTEFGAQEIGKSDKNWGAAMEAPSAPPPPPIQMTRLVSQTEPRTEIVLERPLDADAGVEEEEPPEPRRGADLLTTQQPPPQKEGATFLSIPPSILQGICDYRACFDRHLRGLSHEPVGSFDPWHIAQSLAEELMEEALADVAAELHELCEDYAEAVFTSEFLQASPE